MKYLLPIGLVALVLALSTGMYFLWKKNKELDNKLKYTNSLYEDASLQLGRATTELGDANKKVNQLSNELQGQLKARQEVAKQYGELHTKYQVVVNQAAMPVEHSGTIVDPTEPGFEFSEGHYYLATDAGGTTLIDLGPDLKFGFKDSRIVIAAKLATGVSKETKQLTPMSDISYKLQLRIKTLLITTIDPQGRENTYAEMYEMDESGSKILGKFSTDKFYVVKDDQRKKHMEWWNPHLDAGVLAGLETYTGKGHFGGSVGISLMSYGLTKNDMTWRFLRPGVTLSNKIGVDLAPVMYNVGEPLPLVSDLYIGPYIGTDFSNVGVGLLLNTVL